MLPGRDHVWVFLYDYGVCLEYARWVNWLPWISYLFVNPYAMKPNFWVDSIFFVRLMWTTFRNKFSFHLCSIFSPNAKTRRIPAGLENSIFAQYLGDITPGMECFNTWKDVVIPPFINNPAIIAGKSRKHLLGSEAVQSTMSVFLPILIALWGATNRWPIRLVQVKVARVLIQKVVTRLPTSGEASNGNCLNGTRPRWTTAMAYEILLTGREYEGIHLLRCTWRVRSQNHQNLTFSCCTSIFSQRYHDDDLFSLHQGASPDYIQEMKSSVFCLAPLG